MEYGPRALGNRSILADPGHPEMRDRINAMVKNAKPSDPSLQPARSSKPTVGLKSLPVLSFRT